jgi:hypothetical protein
MNEVKCSERRDRVIAMYNTLTEKLQPMVYELGFLKE